MTKELTTLPDILKDLAVAGIQLILTNSFESDGVALTENAGQYVLFPILPDAILRVSNPADCQKLTRNRGFMSFAGSKRTAYVVVTRSDAYQEFQGLNSDPDWFSVDNYNNRVAALRAYDGVTAASELLARPLAERVEREF